ISSGKRNKYLFTHLFSFKQTNMFFSVLYIFMLAFTHFNPFTQSSPAKALNEFLEIHYAHYCDSGNILEEKVMAKKGKKEVIKAYAQWQADFRKIQFLLEYISEETIKRYVNGPPLP